jgi:transposase
MPNDVATTRAEAGPGGSSRRYYVGIDVGYREHVACCIALALFNPGKGKDRWRTAKCLTFKSTATGFAQLQRYLDAHSTNYLDFVILHEATGGQYGLSLVAYLRNRGYQVHQCDNRAVKDYRTKIFGGETKTDAMDARLMARMAFLHETLGEEFSIQASRLARTDAVFLRSVTTDRWRLSKEATRYKNQLQQILSATFPELKDFFATGTAGKTCRVLLGKYGTPAQLAAADFNGVKELLVESNCLKFVKHVPMLLETAKHSAGVIATHQMLWRQDWLLQQLNNLDASMAALDQGLEQFLESHPWTPIFQSLPAYSPIWTATLIGVIGDIERFSTLESFRAYVGFSPRVEQSGTSIHSSALTSGGARDTRRVLFQMMFNLIGPSARPNVFRELYDRHHKERGKPGLKAIGTLCGKLAGVMYMCLKDGKVYEEAKHRQALRLPASPGTTGKLGEEVPSEESIESL